MGVSCVHLMRQRLHHEIGFGRQTHRLEWQVEESTEEQEGRSQGGLVEELRQQHARLGVDERDSSGCQRRGEEECVLRIEHGGVKQLHEAAEAVRSSECAGRRGGGGKGESAELRGDGRVGGGLDVVGRGGLEEADASGDVGVDG